MIKKEGYITYITEDNPVPHTEKVTEFFEDPESIRITCSTRTFYFYTQTKGWSILKYDKIGDIYNVKFEGKVLDFEYKICLSQDYNY